MNYNRIPTYFAALATANPDIQQHYHGDAEEIINRINHNLQYPILWSETPEWKPVLDADYTQIQYTGHIVLLQQLNKNKDNEHDTLDQTQALMLQILYHIREDVKKAGGRVKIESSSAYAVPESFIDQTVGWRVNYVITFPYDFRRICQSYTQTPF